jgi:hypothetical protein
MKKIWIFLLILCLVLGNFSSVFAEDMRDKARDNAERSYMQKKLFEIEMDRDCMRPFRDIEYHAEEEALYVLTPNCENNAGDRTNQLVFDLDGNEISNPKYPITSDGLIRSYIEFDSGKAYSSDYEINIGQSETRVYDLDENKELGIIGFDTYRGGFKVSGNYVAYRKYNSGDDEEPKFYIGTLNPFIDGEELVPIYSESRRVKAFDFNPEGTELIYGSYVSSEASVNYGIRITRVNVETGMMITEFLIDGTDVEDEDKSENLALSLYVTNNYIVVLSHLDDLDIGKVQRFTYDGTLVDEVETNFQVRGLTEGPNGTSIYVEKRFEENTDDPCDGHFEVVQVNWNAKNPSGVGRPKAVISEKTVGGKTLAEFKDAGFGLLKVVDPETGAVDYKAPLKSDKNDVRLRIPFADMHAKLAAGAKHLLINYKGQEIFIPMSVFDCADLMAGMPCEDDATIEIHLVTDEAGNVTVTVQLFVVEQVNSMMKVVHRKTIQY